MATDKLKIYNGALIKAGARELGSLSEDNDRRRALDEVWDDGGVNACLEAGQWVFATKAEKLDYDTSISPTFGYKRAFQKDSDWILTTAVCQDEFFHVPLLQYTDEAGYLYADLATIYVKYVSSAAGYGGDYSLWPATFTDYVKSYFAWRIAPRVNQDEERRDNLMKELDALLRTAKNRNQIALPTKFPAQGSWSSSRGGRRHGGDRGNSGSLIG